MREIPIAGETCCANCVHDATCSHRSALPGIALICDHFVNRTFPPEVQDAIQAGACCHICGAPAIIGGGGRVTCGNCLFRQNAGGVGGWAYIFVDDRQGQVGSDAGVLVTDTPTGGEYLAIIKALRAARDAGYREVVVYSDCTGVVNHLAGRARVFSPRVLPLYRRSVELLDAFDPATVEYVSRNHPHLQAADALGCEAVARRTGAWFPARWWHKSNAGAPQGWRAARAVPAAEGWG